MLSDPQRYVSLKRTNSLGSCTMSDVLLKNNWLGGQSSTKQLAPFFVNIVLFPFSLNVLINLTSSAFQFSAMFCC